MLDQLRRILLITDGTLTEVLEAAHEEKILLIPLEIAVTQAATGVADLDLAPGAYVMNRKILLRGERTETNYVYAESQLALDHFEPVFRAELIKGAAPIGRLWLEHRLETWKERREHSSLPAGPLAEHFAIAPEAELLVRRYRVFNNRKPIILITEYFPA